MKLILIIIIILLFLNIICLKKNEFETFECNFVQEGLSKDECIAACDDQSLKNLPGRNTCNYEICSQKCANIQEGVNDMMQIKLNAPLSQEIRAIPGKNEIYVQWIVKELDNLDNRIFGYIIQYYKTFKKMDGIFTINISNEDNIFIENGTLNNNILTEYDKVKNNNTYKINGLDNGDQYSVILTGINRNGIGEISNIATATPSEIIQIKID